MLRCFVFLLAVVGFAARLEAADRPNLLFIIADDASRDSFGCYGAKYVKTPSLDRIAREGVRFTQAYNCNPKCAPARACLLTGRYSWQLGAACNHFCYMPDNLVFYPYLLEADGYTIGFTGKGWGPGHWHGRRAHASGKDNPAGHPYNKRRQKPPLAGIADIDYSANFKDFLDETPEGKPFCFWLGTHEPHRTYGKDNWKLDGRNLNEVVVPSYWPDNEVIRGDLADYAIEVEWFDQHIGRALDYLDAAGKLDNTIIIATSDHGMPFPRVKGQVYDHGFRVPLVVRWGARIQAGRTVTDFVTFPDLAPTLLEVAGVRLHPQMTGESFVVQLLSKESGRIDPSRDHTLLGKERHDLGRTDGQVLTASYPVRAIRTDRYLYARNFMPHRWPVGDPEYGLRNCDDSPTKRFLMAIPTNSAERRWYELSFGKRSMEELYDIQEDPDCVNNLATDPAHAAAKTRLWKRLESRLVAQQDPRVLGDGDVFDQYPYSNRQEYKQVFGQEAPYKDPYSAQKSSTKRPAE